MHVYYAGLLSNLKVSSTIVEEVFPKVTISWKFAGNVCTCTYDVVYYLLYFMLVYTVKPPYNITMSFKGAIVNVYMVRV